MCATSDYLLKHSHGPCLPVYQSCATTIVGAMVKRADDKAVEGNDGKTLQQVVQPKAHKAEKASKTSAQPPKQRLPNSYVSRQLGQLHRGNCMVTSMRP